MQYPHIKTFVIEMKKKKIWKFENLKKFIFLNFKQIQNYF